MPPPTTEEELLRYTLIGLQAEKARIDDLIQRLSFTSQPENPNDASDGAKPKRVVSAVSRARMRKAQKRVWAEKRRVAAEAAGTQAKRKGRKNTPQALANMRAAQRKRWAAAKKPMVKTAAE